MNRLMVKDVRIEKNKLSYEYSLEGEWSTYFKKSEKFYIEYSQEIYKTNASLAVIPLITNILPIAWILDAEIIVEELDKNFYESIEDFKKGYIEMYPQLEFKGKVSVEKFVDNTNYNNNKSIIFFSGGVDAYQTLISHIEDKPTLLTIWGADVELDDLKGWSIVEEHTKSVAIENQLDYLFIKSSFRKIIDEGALTKLVWEKANDGWWHGFQHGIGLLGHVAPYVKIAGIGVSYIASSFTIEDRGKITCASDPTIDNYVHFAKSHVVHDGYEFSRQMKIANITEYVEKNQKNIKLRVCWQSRGGKNCCQCEKCYRTILGIMAEGGDPNRYGFDYDKKKLKLMMLDLRTKTIISENFRYKYIQDNLRNNFKEEEVNKELMWLYKLSFSDGTPSMTERVLYNVGKLRGLKRIMYKIKVKIVGS